MSAVLKGDSQSTLIQKLNVGIISTNLDFKAAYSTGPSMCMASEDSAWHEIKSALHTFQQGEPKPNLVLIPELSIPRRRLLDLMRAACEMDMVLIGGLEYERVPSDPNKVRNEAVLLVPNHRKMGRSGFRCRKLFLGKACPAVPEQSILNRWGVEMACDPVIYIITSSRLGNIGVAICSDLFDLQRMQVYWGQIDHLVVVAYNTDVDQYTSLADNLSKLLFANVIICNTGKNGGSAVYSPKHRPHNLVYSVAGSRLFSYQVVSVEVRALRQERGSPSGSAKLCEACEEEKKTKVFKPVPPQMPKMRVAGGKRRVTARRISI